jgi:3-hydroxy acid dehydrogenase/malonic semialdehyde reductase
MPSNKTALVTGASSGIGEAVSRELIKRGWQVIGIARSGDKLSKIQEELSNTFIPLVCDVSKKEEIEVASKKIRDQNLCPSLFFLNAGIAGESVIENPNKFDLAIHEKNHESELFWCFSMGGILGKTLPGKWGC